MIDLDNVQLKRLGARNLAAAIDKAEQYRALNQPEEAESICQDILAEDPTHQAALRLLGLALTDRFEQTWQAVFDEAVATFKKLTNPYEATYYEGVAWERLAKAQLISGQPRNAAHSYAQAMDLFAEAETKGPKDTPDPILRWNRCARAVQASAEMRRALREPHSHEFQHGD